MKCPICCRKHPLRKHGAYVRYFCDLAIGAQQINILRYYCSGCGGTVSYLPSFAVARKQFSARIISICLQLILACGLSFKGVNRAYPCVSRVLAWSWIKRWYYNSNGIISVMRNYFEIRSQKSDVCSYHNSSYISGESLEAFGTGARSGRRQMTRPKLQRRICCTIAGTGGGGVHVSDTKLYVESVPKFATFP